MEYRDAIGPLAVHYWGEPNHALSKQGKELRFGTHGSKSVDLVKGTWFDHEADEGGGAASLVSYMEPDAVVRERLAQFGLPLQDQKPQRNEQTWHYFDQDGELRYEVIRYTQNGEKTYRQRRYQNGAPKWGMMGVTALPYRLHDIINSTAPIFICEGEKCADAVADLGLVATTNHGGAGKWWPALTQWFAGRQVIILPDNDAPGERHARVVADALSGTANSIRIVRLPDLPNKGDVVDWLILGGNRDQLSELVKKTPIHDPLIASEIPPEPFEQQPGAKSRVQLIPWDEVQDVEIRWLIDGLVPAKGFSALYGKPGSYKSFVALYVASMVATGQEAFGRVTEAGDVVYLMGEGGSGLKPRRDALIKQYNLPASVKVHFIRAQLNLRSTDDDASALIAAVQAKGLNPKLLIIDTLARAFGAGNENASEDMGAFILQCGRIQEELGTAVLIVHHSGKDEARGQRGHSSLLGACDAELEVVKISADNNSERIGQLTVTKQKDGEDGFKINYRMVDVQLSPIYPERTSLAVEPMQEDEMVERKRKAKPVTGNQKTLLNALQEALDIDGQQVKLEQIPSSARCVRVSLWRQCFYQISPQDAETKRRTWNRTSQQLQDGGTVRVWGNWVWRSE